MDQNFALHSLSVRKEQFCMKSILVLFVFLCSVLFSPVSVLAAITSTTASLSSHSGAINSSTQFHVTINNTDAEDIHYVRITWPSDTLTMTETSADWGVSQDDHEAILSNGTIASGDSLDIPITVDIGGIEQTGVSWTVMVSDSLSGDDLYTATGDLSYSLVVTPASSPTPTDTVSNDASTPTPTNTSSSTTTRTIMVTPTPIPDTIHPIVVLHALPNEGYREIPSVRLTASDQSGIASLWYSINGAKFIRLDGIGSSTSKPLDVTFKPKHALTSGVYRLQLKAIDQAGNSSMSEKIAYTLDTIAPKILLSTTIASIKWALDRVGDRTILIAGGRHKGGDFSVLRSSIQEKVRVLVAFGEAKELLRRAFEDLVEVRSVASLKEAVNEAVSVAEPGGTVLFSPGCASFDLFRDYKERGEQFKKLVASIQVHVGPLGTSRKALVTRS